MADVASKQQTTALFLSTVVTRTRRRTRTDKPDGKTVCFARERSFQFNLEGVRPFTLLLVKVLLR